MNSLYIIKKGTFRILRAFLDLVFFASCRKSINNFYFYFWELFLIYFILFYESYIFGKCPIENYFLFYFILLVLYFLEESYWDCASEVSFLL